MFAQIVKSHELTWQEKRDLAETIMSLDGISSDEAKILSDLDASHDTSAVDERESFIDKLKENLQILKADQAQHTFKTPAAPHTVLGIIAKVVKNHKMTNEERVAFVSAVSALKGDVSVDEIQVIQEMEKMD